MQLAKSPGEIWVYLTRPSGFSDKKINAAGLGADQAAAREATVFFHRGPYSACVGTAQ